jgi:hypothetical protein
MRPFAPFPISLCGRTRMPPTAGEAQAEGRPSAEKAFVASPPPLAAGASCSPALGCLWGPPRPAHRTLTIEGCAIPAKYRVARALATVPDFCRRQFDLCRRRGRAEPEADPEALKPDSAALSDWDRWVRAWLANGRASTRFGMACPWKCDFHLRVGIPEIERFHDRPSYRIGTG